MSGICIDKLPHSCGTRKGLQVFADKETGKVDGFCYSCNTYISNPYGKPVDINDVEFPKEKTSEEIAIEMAEISGYPVVDLPHRKLRKKYLEDMGIKIAMNESDGKTPSATYFPMYKDGKLSGYYAKTLSKPSVQWSIGDVKNVEPFNWNNAKKSGAYKLIIVEGREDAVAVASIFDRHGKEEYKPAVIALSNGTNSVDKCLTPVVEDIKRLFKEVVICFDMDKAGQKAVEKAILLIPTATVATLPENDPNDCIINGAQKSAYNALAFNSTSPKTTRLVVSNPELHLSAREPTPRGELTWPWPTLDDKMRGMRLGETIYIGAGVKMGKSEVVDTLAAHILTKHNIPVLLAKPEQENKKTYKKILGKIAGKQFDDPDVEFDTEAFDEAGKILGDKLFMLNLYQHMGWDSLKTDITIAANYGAKAVFIDPITNLTAGMRASEANDFLTGMTRELSHMSMDLGIVSFLFCHLKAPEGNISSEQRKKAYNEGRYHRLGNCPHELGGSVLSPQFAGSRAMMQSCNLMLGLEGNKDEQLDDSINNTRWITILEDREFGNTGSIPLYWNRNTTRFKEI